jgi:SAM-dependent methyltransferase
MTDPVKYDCLACGSSRLSELRTVPDFEYGVPYRAGYASCENCGTTIQVPMPTPAQLSSFYPAAYHSQTSHGLLHRIRCRMRLRQLLPLPLSEGVVLDYGCGNGSFLAFAADRLPDVRWFGYEVGPRRRVTTLRDGRVTLVEGSLADLLALLPPCRLLSMNHVIEHLPDPGFVLSSLSRKLLPGAVLAGQTPVAGSWEHQVFGPRWSGYHAPRHTVVFSREGLRECLTRQGFRRIRIDPAINPAGLAVSLASAATVDPPRGITRQGLPWLGWLAAGACLVPLDLVLGRPGIMNFRAETTAAV